MKKLADTIMLAIGFAAAAIALAVVAVAIICDGGAPPPIYDSKDSAIFRGP